jgi:hypothetical protein
MSLYAFQVNHRDVRPEDANDDRLIWVGVVAQNQVQAETILKYYLSGMNVPFEIHFLNPCTPRSAYQFDLDFTIPGDAIRLRREVAQWWCEREAA